MAFAADGVGGDRALAQHMSRLAPHRPECGRDRESRCGRDRIYRLVKTASEVLRRHEQQLHALHHKSITVTARSERITVTLDIVPDEDDPHTLLGAHDAAGQVLARVRVAASFKLSAASATAWIENDFRRPD